MQKYVVILECIAWHFRRDHFDNGALIQSIAQGHMLRMLKAYAAKERKRIFSQS